MLETIFVSSTVVLCAIHVLRYFREKVLTGKAFWGEAGDKNYLCGADKDDIMTNTKLLRDSPSQDAFEEREAKLVDSTKELFVRPGQVQKPVSFHDYYEKNWKHCAFRWVFAFRKNLPTKGANDTQAAESTFRAIKHYMKVEFGSRTPSLHELILVLPKILDKRSAERALATAHRRIIYHYKNPEFDKALEQGSWELNAGGMKAFHEALTMADDLKERFEVVDGDITETYTGQNTAHYKGNYKTDGFSCNCSWFSSRKLCRHPLVYRLFHSLPLFDLKMFHSSFRVNPVEENELEDIDTSVDMFDTLGNVNSQLGRPGMEHLLEEQKKNSRRLKKNVKYNKAFDTAKVAAEYLSHYSTDLFEKNLKAFNQFTELLRVGVPDELIDLLNNDGKKPTKPSTKVGVTRSAHVRETPDVLKHAVGHDFLIYSIPGDGSCLYGSTSAHIYHDEFQVSNLRRIVHSHIFENWWYYAPFIAFPFKEIVGDSSSHVHLKTEAEFLEFLLSERSMKCFSNGADLAAISNLFNINIGIFTHGLGGNLQPRWTWQTPDPVIAAFSEYFDPSITDMFLFHSDNVHYELFVERNSRLATEGNVPARLLTKLTPQNILEPPSLTTLEEMFDTLDREEAEYDRIVQATPKQTITNHLQSQQECEGISPMTFKPCPRGPGRPKLTRAGAPQSKAPKKVGKRPRTDDDDCETPFQVDPPELPRKEAQPPSKKPRGRPKGSKNKQKQSQTKTTRERAVEAATADDDDDPFFDSGDKCEICEFAFNHPLKQKIKKITCPHCTVLVHQPCYDKSGCVCQS